MARLRRTILSFLFVTLAYGVYALCVVPIVEPDVGDDELIGGDTLVGATSTVTDQFVRELTPLFPEGSWELDHPRVLRSEQVTFLLKEFEELDDGRLQVRPCTVVHYGANREQGAIGTTIMQAPEGAILEFDKKLGLSSGDFSAKPVAVQLVGGIRIVRLSENRDEDLELTTSNVRITEKQIWTRDRVSFRLGNTEGQGSNLLITRTVASAREREDENLLQDLGTIELQQVQELSFLAPDGELFDSFASPGAIPNVAPTSKSAPTKITVRCQGPMIIDFQRMKATLEDQVVVSRHCQGQQPDTMSASHLWMDFARTNPPQSARESVNEANSNAKKQPALEVTRIVAEGKPLVIDARSMQGYLESQRLEYSFRTRNLKLFGNNPFAASPVRSDGQVRLQTPQYQMEAPSIEFHNHEDRSKWEFHAQGGGNFRGVLDGDSQVQASWKTGLQMIRQQDQQVLVMQGDATAATPQSGSMRADEIELWLRPMSKQIGTRLDGTPVMKSTAIPTRLVTRSLAGNKTQIDSPQLRGTLTGIEVYFEPNPNAVPGALATQQNSFSPPRFGQFTGQGAVPSKKSQKQFKIVGGMLNVWVDPSSEEVYRMALRGHSKIVESTAGISANAGSRPLQLEGESIDVWIQGGSPIASLVGTPASIGAPDLDVEGSRIEFNAERNVIHIPGSGSMTVMVANDLLSRPGVLDRQQPGQDSRPGPPARLAPKVLKPVEVSWQEGFHFDGQVASVSGRIRATGEDLSFAANDVKITLDQTIDFAQLNSREVQPELRFVSARGEILVGVQSRDDQNQPKSFQRMSAKSFDLDLVSGELRAEGPGRLSLTSAGKLIPSLGSPSSPSNDRNPNELTHVAIAFNKQMKGNIVRREVHLFDNIRAWMGPVESWTAAVDPTQRRVLRKNDVLMACFELFVLESPTAPPGRQRKPIELLARGDAYVEGQLYAATGHEIKYAEEKDMLTLEGDARRPAQLFQRSSPDERGTTQGKVRRIRYWPKSNKALLDGFQGFDVSRAPDSNQTK